MPFRGYIIKKGWQKNNILLERLKNGKLKDYQFGGKYNGCYNVNDRGT